MSGPDIVRTETQTIGYKGHKSTKRGPEIEFTIDALLRSEMVLEKIGEQRNYY